MSELCFHPDKDDIEISCELMDMQDGAARITGTRESSGLLQRAMDLPIRDRGRIQLAQDWGDIA